MPRGDKFRRADGSFWGSDSPEYKEWADRLSADAAKLERAAVVLTWGSALPPTARLGKNQEKTK